MKFTNNYNFTSNFDISANVIGKGLELLKNKLFNNKEEKGAVQGDSSINWNLHGETTLEISVEEMIELHKEYGANFDHTVKYIKEELRPVCKELMGAIDDATRAFQKTLHDAEDRERAHNEKIIAESEAKEEKSED